jgi:hypothetical protein
MGAFADVAVCCSSADMPWSRSSLAPSGRGVLLSNGRWTGLPRWQTRYGRRPPSEEELARWGIGDTGVGIVGGAASHGAVAADIDTDDPAIRGTLAAVVPGSTVRKVGKRGETLFFHAPHVTASKKWLIDGKVICELIGPGRQTVIPPTIHPDTNAPYRWSGTEGLAAVAGRYP